jgi:hypothetical protein
MYSKKANPQDLQSVQHDENPDDRNPHPASPQVWISDHEGHFQTHEFFDIYPWV